MKLRLLILIIVMGSTVAEARGQTTRPTIAKIHIVLAGDSTVNDNTGWGIGFAKCMSADIQVVNLAKNGRSSKSFIAEGFWKQCLDLKPDYILIQFGHNDQPGHGAAIETDPQTTYRQYMNQYVDDSRAAGIKPILITSLSRRQWGSDGKIHSTLVPNVEVVKEIAIAKHVPLIDLHAKSIELYELLGKSGCEEFSPLTKPATNPATPFDGTHLNAFGSTIIGSLVAQELKKAAPELAAFIR